MLNRYIAVGALFPPSMWAAPPALEHSPRTTNGVESFHKHLKDTFVNSHPNIYIFSENLLQLQEHTYIRLQGSTIGARNITTYEQERRNFLNEKYMFLAGMLSRKQYIHNISFKFLVLPVI